MGRPDFPALITTQQDRPDPVALRLRNRTRSVSAFASSRPPAANPTQYLNAPYNAAMSLPASHAGGLSTDSNALPETLEPKISSDVPGPESRALAARLARVESHNVTALRPAAPIFWERASYANLWDVDGNRYVDLTAAFGVSNVGHAHPEIVQAISRQAESLMHGMGDVHPARVKVELLERLSELYPKGSASAPPAIRTVLSSSGSDAVETAIKTAMLATGRAGILAFEGGYHGLSLGALDSTWRSDFREPFRARLPELTHFLPYGDLDAVRALARGEGGIGSDTGSGRSIDADSIGAILVEPIQGRGGERRPTAGFLRGLREICDERGWLLIADEIYTGFGRTGARFACDHESVVPDLLCVGKGLASGMPISACLGLARVFDAWPVSEGESIHTQTFLGHPTSCAAALASLAVADRWRLTERAERLGDIAQDSLRTQLDACPSVVEVRGLGMMIGIECTTPEISLEATRRLLEKGYVLLPSGDGGRVLSLTPPLVIGESALRRACDEIALVLGDLSAPGRTSE